MLTIANITYRIAGRTILDNASATLAGGWKVGVVGANGAGKSTLFKLISGELQADGGELTLSQNQTFGQVKQDIPDSDTSLLDIVLEADEERASLLEQSETETDPYKLADIHTRLNDIDAYAAPARASTILAGLGFKEAQLSEPISAFSGGWRMRVALAAALFRQPDFLLLDEPTNHLDLEAIMWLENYLMSYPHTVLVISHDRDILNKCVDHILHVENQGLTLYTGSYDAFERERAEKLANQQKLHEKQQAQKAHMEKYIERFRYKASKAKQAQSRIKALEKMDFVGAVMEERSIQFKFPQPDELAPPVISIDRADVGYEENNPVLKSVHERIDMDDRIALLGANGNGKSTLIKLIADKLNPMAGEVARSSKLRIGYFSQHQAEEMDMNSTPYLEMNHLMEGKGESKVRALLGKFGFNKTLSDNKIAELSGGEKARLLFALMSYNAPHMLLLDEPTNHLDMAAREALVKALNMYEGAVVIVSHDPSMLERVADRLWLVENSRVEPFEGDLDTYRQHVVSARRTAKREEKQQDKPKKRTDTERKKKFPKLFKEANRLERELSKLTQRKDKFEREMASPTFYENVENAQEVDQKYTKLVARIAETETAWIAAQDAYENA